ncbi:hypothetical protein Kkor_0196 [Kangiella koreensis DSM 16069]|uniref:Lipoprotein n=1 Tax=Kangiella koreensis (strain DSM 16069 / JCM 12317 / KCTC 12182 / SW-125) TaxID=523791 RepID=C7R6V1_KANKD|nr:hypothetical protein Kkor_0196 [Kangiella koreensis DSM 16069]
MIVSTKHSLILIIILLSGCAISEKNIHEDSCTPSLPWVNGKPVENSTHNLYKPSESERTEVFKQITDWPNYGLECWYIKNNGNLELYSEAYLDMVSYEFEPSEGHWIFLKKYEYIFLVH